MQEKLNKFYEWFDFSQIDVDSPRALIGKQKLNIFCEGFFFRLTKENHLGGF